MSAEEVPPPAAPRVRTDTAFAKAIRAASEKRTWRRPDLAAHAHVPLSAVHAIYRCGPVRPEFVAAVCRSLELPPPRLLDLTPLLKLGRLLRDRREKAGLSRKALGRLAKLSDATVKFIETALHAPSRATCLRLLSVAALELTWSDLAPFAGAPPAPDPSTSEPPVFRLDPRLSLEMVREQMLLIDQLRLHQYGQESGLTGWRRVCWCCRARSLGAAGNAEAAQHLPIRHHAACLGQLAESLVGRYPVLSELAQTERDRRRTLTAQRLHHALQRTEPERLYGCRGAADLSEQLAEVSAGLASPYRSGAASVLLWALHLGPCPMGFTSAPFTEGAARGVLAALSAGRLATAPPAEFLRGVSETVAWILESHAPPPLGFSEPPAPALAPSDS